MAEIVARGQISIIDLNDAKSLNMYLRSNQPTTQIYNTDNGQFTPSWDSKSPTGPLEIKPELYVSGTTTNQINNVKSVKYTINGSEMLSNFGASVSDISPYTLTINQNMNVSQMRIQCEAIYVDPNMASFETPVKAEIQFTKSTSAGATICAISYTPKGNVFKNDQTSKLTAHCDLWRGSVIDDTNVKYQWFKMVDGVWTELTADNHGLGCTGFDTNELTIPASVVLNFDSFKCKITDTDGASSTHNQFVEDVLSFFDQSDPYYVEIYSTTGDKILNGKGSTTLTAKVWQAGECFEEVAANSKFNFTWKKFNADGTQDKAWGTGGTKSGASLEVTSADVTSKATFVCELSNKAQ